VGVVVTLEGDVIAAGPRLVLEPVGDGRMTDQVEQVLLEVEQDRVPDEVTAGVDRDVLLGLARRKAANELTPKSLSSRSASGPDRNGSVM
jgi:hypothetical protein